ncbi:hypothetical protein BGI36_03555 [Snodgrassella communis]|jgi:hypothetical protein|uniref:hypothetical protein n=1 Tax=Snodgrassella communis TaxID=2946699 RepID=UPI000C1E968F|nr:hypothetical protein [Snodgrassella communis]PIT19868.1 hypothetical protein BGI35_09260 [Snodgrassella communis]PIT22405.1 hypothetical protein BGI36_03555 [Snodgrassella communis]WMY91669.1 hypothetical protein PYG29_09590 [Snodgrassella communis]
MKKIMYIFFEKLKIYTINFVIFFLLVEIFLYLISYYDMRYADRETLHGDFTIVVFDDETFYPLKLSKLKDFQKEDFSFISAKKVDRKEWDAGDDTPSSFSYSIKKIENGNQIETKFKDPERTVWSTYQVVDNNIIPIKSRLYAFDYILLAMVLAFLTTYGLNNIRRYIKLNKDN